MNKMKALLVIDFINEIVDDKGKLSGKGYASFIRENSTFEKLNDVITKFRTANLPIIFVRLAFKGDYSDQPKSSPVFGKAHEFGILSEGTWSTEVHASVDKKDSDTVITKNRVSAFHNTGLTKLLRDKGVTDVYICAVATDLAGEAAARSAHDDDFKVIIVADACAAANSADHEKSLAFLPKIATVMNVGDLNL